MEVAASWCGVYLAQQGEVDWLEMTGEWFRINATDLRWWGKDSPFSNRAALNIVRVATDYLDQSIFGSENSQVKVQTKII